jgi:hypothetical protein
MPQGKDRYHKQALRSLENDGWTITHDPFKFRFGFPAALRIDIGATLGNRLEAQQSPR